MDDRRQEHFSKAAKGEVATEYFQKLFKSTNPGDFMGLFEGFRSRVTDGMNKELTREVDREEVKYAFFSSKPSVLPVPMG